MARILLETEMHSRNK